MSDPIFVIGIDPGVSGGIALVRLGEEGPAVLDGVAMPIERGLAGPIGRDRRTVSFVELRNVVVKMVNASPPLSVWAAVERQDIRPRQQGHAPIMFNYGIVAAAVLDILGPSRVAWPMPADWKRDVGAPADKRRSMKLATQIFGARARADYWHVLARDGVAEAALIGFWRARRVRGLLDANRNRQAEGGMAGPGEAG